MFQSARIKLTAWYVFIIMLVCIFFSVLIYRGLTFELARGLHMQALKMAPPEDSRLRIFKNRDGDFYVQRMPFMFEVKPSALPNPEVFEEAKNRILLQIVILNVAILLISSLASYFLAGKTLAPIEAMVNQQKRFIADASHELRTPLTAIKTEIEVALRDKNITKSEMEKLLESNVEEIDKLTALSNYLLKLSRYENTTSSLNFQTVNLNEEIEQSIEKIKKYADKRNIKIEYKPINIKIESFNSSLTELFVILLDNATKYSPTSSTINVITKQTSKFTIIQVKDRGIGIKASDIPYIFNRFYRADLSRAKEKIDGYGLGLSIAKSIVDLHHGKIDIDSTPGKGSTFSVTLPVKQKHRFVS